VIPPATQAVGLVSFHEGGGPLATSDEPDAAENATKCGLISRRNLFLDGMKWDQTEGEQMNDHPVDPVHPV
jgi:hypothetical protein